MCLNLSKKEWKAHKNKMLTTADSNKKKQLDLNEHQIVLLEMFSAISKIKNSVGG